MTTVRKALKILRDNGFSTYKERRSGTWFMSKPYNRGACLSLTNGNVTHVWVATDYDSERITWEEFMGGMK